MKNRFIPKTPVIMKITNSLLRFFIESWQNISLRNDAIQSDTFYWYNLFIRIKRCRTAAYLVLSSQLLLTSCIKEDPQPCPLLQVEISVKDKNYFNIDLVPQEARKSESLAFRAYVPTLYYALRNTETGKIVKEQGVFNVTVDDPVFTITFSEDLPMGKYALTVWGGLPDNSSLTEDSQTNLIHANGKEASDTYLTTDLLIYDPQHTHHSVDLERITGKLILLVTDLPDASRYSSETINGIYERINQQFEYRNPTIVTKQNSWNSAPEVVLSTLLAPSEGEYKSLFHLDFYESPEQADPVLTPKDVNITLKRNELTAVKYVYDDEREDFFIYLLLNDKWELIHNLDID